MNNLKLINNHIFAASAQEYVQKGYSVIPDRYMGKAPAIKGWSDFCERHPSKDEINHWSENLTSSNIAVCCGPASNIIALDIDCVDEKILEVIMPVMPDSPVIKRGAKGETRFFRYNGENTFIKKIQDQVVFEILSVGKKTTLPPSVHPNGYQYEWLTAKTLLDFSAEELPILPPLFIPNMENLIMVNFPSDEYHKKKSEEGRNNALSSLCGALVQQKVEFDEAIKKLIEYDKDNHDVPLFSDPTHYPHTEPSTNAGTFYFNHLNSVNTKHFRSNTEYEIPLTASAINREYERMVSEGKSQGQAAQKKSNLELPPAQGVIKTLQSNILKNSYIKQPAFALSASLALLASLVSRKFTFQGIAPNLYVLNVASSGSGKEAPQKRVKEIIGALNAEYLLGNGDYVSDASLTDFLDLQPSRLDIIDEAGGFFKSVNSGNGGYNGKMGDILAELYTASTTRYLGRAVASGNKGSCDRPCVNLLCSTTPTGLSEGISTKAIEKGLVGRFLIFEGIENGKANRLLKTTYLDPITINKLQYFAQYQPAENTEFLINGRPQMVEEIEATDLANRRLDGIFSEFDALRCSTKAGSALKPIVSRLYQQMLKAVLLHAVGRAEFKKPVVEVVDVDFGYALIKYYYASISSIVEKYIFKNTREHKLLTVLAKIRFYGVEGITKARLMRETRDLSSKERNEILEELIQSEVVFAKVENDGSKRQTKFYGELS